MRVLICDSVTYVFVYVRYTQHISNIIRCALKPGILNMFESSSAKTGNVAWYT